MRRKKGTKQKEVAGIVVDCINTYINKIQKSYIRGLSIPTYG